MTKKKDLKRRVRERAAKTGESYAAARKQVLDARGPKVLDARESPASPPASDGPAWLKDLSPEKLRRRQSLIVDLAFDASAIPPELRDGGILGLACAVVPHLELHREGLARKALEGFKAALAALAGDPAAVLLRRFASEGIGPPMPSAGWIGKASSMPQARLFPFDPWTFSREGFPLALAMLQRLEAGLVGLGPDGRSLAFFIDGRVIIAICAMRGEEKVIQLETKESWTARVKLLQSVFGPRAFVL